MTILEVFDSVAVIGIFIVCSFVMVRLVKEVVSLGEMLRQRIEKLEEERDALVHKMSEAAGGPLQTKSAPNRGEWHDPDTGFIHYSDGEIVGRDGEQLFPPTTVEADTDGGS